MSTTYCRKQGRINFFHARPMTYQSIMSPPTIKSHQTIQTIRQLLSLSIQVLILIFILVTTTSMSFKSSQQEKFKNIVLKVEPIRSHSPDTQTSNLIKPTSSPTNHNANPRTPINIYRFFGKETHILYPEISQTQQGSTYQSNTHSQGYIKPQNTNSNILTENSKHPSTMLITSQIQQSQQELIARLQSQIHEKAQIIAQLKNIIRISNENNAKGKYKTIFFTQKSPQRKSDDQERQLKELRHNVKILTIENNSLSDYIDRLKATLGEKQVDYIDVSIKQYQREQSVPNNAKQIERLNKIIRERQLQYEQKIDQFVNSHKSLAHQCKMLEQTNNKLQHENQIITQRLKEYQQTVRKQGQNHDDKTKNTSIEKFTIQKIKEQYAESLRQFKETVAYQTDHLFDQFRSHLEVLGRQIVFLEDKIVKLQKKIIIIGEKGLKQSVIRKKSDIYIEEGAESSLSSNSGRRLKDHSEVGFKTVFTSRVYQENKQAGVEATVPLREEIIRLKEIVNELESQIGQRSDYYTFRQRQYQNSAAELSSYRMKYTLKDEELLRLRREREAKENELLEQIDRHKAQINKLQLVYKRERDNMHESYVADIQQKDSIIIKLKAQIQTVRQKYNQCISEMRQIASSSQLQAQLQQENQSLRRELQDCVDRIEQHKHLILLMKQQSGQGVYEQILKDMRDQIYLIRQKYHNDQSELSHLQQEKEQLIAANIEISLRLQESLNKVHKYQQDEPKLRETIRLLQAQNSTLVQRVNYLEGSRAVLQKQMGAKDEIERNLIEQKNQLEKQVVGYLNLVRKKTLEDTKEMSISKCIHQEFGLEQLLTKVDRLEKSLKQKQQFKQQKIARVLSETIADL